MKERNPSISQGKWCEFLAWAKDYISVWDWNGKEYECLESSFQNCNLAGMVTARASILGPYKRPLFTANGNFISRKLHEKGWMLEGIVPSDISALCKGTFSGWENLDFCILDGTKLLHFSTKEFDESKSKNMLDWLAFFSDCICKPGRNRPAFIHFIKRTTLFRQLFAVWFHPRKFSAWFEPLLAPVRTEWDDGYWLDYWLPTQQFHSGTCKSTRNCRMSS